MLAWGVVRPADSNEESCPAPRSPTRPCSTTWPPWTLHSGLRWPNELRKAAETFAGVPDGRDTAHMLRLLAHFLDFG